jgi:hypothetical protein
MFGELLRKLRGIGPDPTQAWPVVRLATTPVLDIDGGLVGSLRFGCPLEEARRVFGKPTRFRRNGRRYGQLLYAGAGFQIDFDEGRLAYVAYFIGPDECLPDPSVVFCRPTLASGLTLGPAFGRAEIDRAFGGASVDQDATETVFTWRASAVTVEIELDAAGLLKRLNAFPT